MTDWLGGAAAGRLQPEDDALREARHEVLATLLAAYVDGELPPETTAQIDAHLLGCSRCRREVAVHHSVSTRLTRVTRPAVSSALEDQVRAAISAAPMAVSSISVSPMAGAPTDAGGDLAAAPGAAAASTMVTTRRRWFLVAASLVGVVATALVASRRDREPVVAALLPAPLVITSPIPLLSLVSADFRIASARDLPGRARDLETVRSAVPFQVEPLRIDDLQLVAAWTTDLDGEVAAVLAYKWRAALVLQYVVSDAWLFRSLAIRGAFAEGRAVGTDASGVGMLAWTTGQGSTIVVADTRWPELLALHPRAR